jgi:hypothetical protein
MSSNYNHHNITNVQEKSHKSHPPYGKGKKSQNLERPTSHGGKGTSMTPKYEWNHRNIYDSKKVLDGYIWNQLLTTSSLTLVWVERPDFTNYIMDFTTPWLDTYV